MTADVTLASRSMGDAPEYDIAAVVGSRHVAGEGVVVLAVNIEHEDQEPDRLDGLRHAARILLAASDRP
jgi:hypothetical protein